MKRRITALLCLLVLLLGGCRARELLEQVQADAESSSSPASDPPRQDRDGMTSRPPQPEASSEPPAAPPPDARKPALSAFDDKAEEILGATCADLMKRHGEDLPLYFDLFEYAFYCEVEQDKTRYSFALPAYPFEQDLIPDQDGRRNRYDFANGGCDPSDFVVTAFSVRGGALAELFGGETPVTATALTHLFGEDRVYRQEWFDGPYWEAGPYQRKAYYLSFPLDDSGEFVTAAWATAGYAAREIVAVCGGLEPETGHIWLSELKNYDDEADEGGGYRTVDPSLLASFEAAPPIEGSLYNVSCVRFRKNEMVTGMDPVPPPSEEDLLGVMDRFPEIRERLETGMTVSPERSPVLIDNRLYFTAVVEGSEPQSAPALYCAVNVDSRRVCIYEYASESWQEMGMESG